eukprot:1161873-Pelagomonas_calceolata.AAC.10
MEFLPANTQKPRKLHCTATSYVSKYLPASVINVAHPKIKEAALHRMCLHYVPISCTCMCLHHVTARCDCKMCLHYMPV